MADTDDLVERLRDAAALPNGLYAEAAAEIERLRSQRKEVVAIAERLTDQRDEPIHDGDTARLHYWRDKAINAAAAIRDLKTQEERG